MATKSPSQLHPLGKYCPESCKGGIANQFRINYILGMSHSMVFAFVIAFSLCAYPSLPEGDAGCDGDLQTKCVAHHVYNKLIHNNVIILYIIRYVLYISGWYIRIRIIIMFLGTQVQLVTLNE